MLSQLIGKNLRDLLDSIGSPACVVEVIEKNKFFFLMANSLFEDAFNLQNFSYVGRKLQDVYLGERATQLEKLLKQCIDKNITIESVESVVFGNTTNHWRFSFRPIKDAKENISRVFVAATNVSRLVELENQLKYEHLLLQVQSDMTPDGVLVVSKKGDYLSWNEKFKAIFRFSEEDMLLGPTVVEPKLHAFMRDPDFFKKNVEKVISRPAEYLGEEEFELVDGRTLIFISRVLTDQEKLSHGRVWFVRDVTNERQSAKKLKSAHAAEEAQNLLLSTLLDLSPDGVIVVATDGAVLSWNRRFKEIWHISDDKLANSSNTVFMHILDQMLHPASFVGEVNRLYADSGCSVDGQELHMKDGRILVWYSRGLVTEIGNVRGRAWFFRDVTSQRLMLRDLREAREWEKSVLESTSQAIITTDRNRIVRIFNPAAEKLLGYSAAEVIGQIDPIAFHDMKEVEQRRKALEKKLSKLINLDELLTHSAKQAPSVFQEWTYITKYGKRLPVELCVSQLYDAEGDLLGYVSVATDISERKAYERRLLELAWTDPLTGIWNRRRFYDVVNKEIHASKRRLEPLSFMLIDIDHFKRINDTYGHDAGDAVLKCVAHKLSKLVRAGDVYCRWGGEEFAILLINTDETTALEVAERICSSFRSLSIKHGKISLEITASIGVSVIIDGDINQTIKRADEGLYKAKNTGRNKVIVN